MLLIRLMMEKFDGVRVFWDGNRLYEKNSKKTLNVPQHITLPSIPFEGELWYEASCTNYLFV
jgi:hypothetical protein